MISEELFNHIVAIRRDIHEQPEIKFDVQRTAEIAATEMEQLGLKVTRNVGKTGVVGDLIVPNATSTIAFRADMDALPIQEEGTPSYRSKVDGKAHLCGHDAHTAMLIGTAHYLSKNPPHQNVRFIFQPSEECAPGGAAGMIRDGCLDDVDSIYGLHVWPWLETGQIGICPGEMMAAADGFDITITGRGGHAAAPHETIDPIVIGSNIVSSLQSLVSRYTNPIDAAVLSITTFHSGSAYNVIPSEAKLSGTMRTYSKTTKAKLKEQFFSIIEKAVNAHSAKATIDYIDGYPPVINSEESCQEVIKSAQMFMDNSQITYPAKKVMFGEDFAYYLEKVPGCFIQLGSGNPQKETTYPLHHPRFNIDEECMRVGISLFSSLVRAAAQIIT